MRGILTLIDFVEFILETCQVLSFNDSINLVRVIGFFSVTVSLYEMGCIISQTPMFLNFSWFVNMALSIFLQNIRCWWLCEVLVGSDIEVRIFSLSDIYDLVASSSNLGHWIHHNLN